MSGLGILKYSIIGKRTRLVNRRLGVGVALATYGLGDIETTIESLMTQCLYLSNGHNKIYCTGLVCRLNKLVYEKNLAHR